MRRVYCGFLACALGLPLLVALGGSIDTALMIAIVTGGVSLFAGVPLFLLFRTRRWLAFWQCLLGGALAGQILAVPFVGFAFRYVLTLDGLVNLLPLLGLLAIYGGMHGALFWLVAVAGNDDLVSPSPENKSPTDYARSL